MQRVLYAYLMPGPNLANQYLIKTWLIKLNQACIIPSSRDLEGSLKAINSQSVDLVLVEYERYSICGSVSDFYVTSASLHADRV